MAGALTRINNNQVTDAVSGNIYLGVNAATKVQEYSVTSGLLANNLVYGSDFTITGNLTINGNTTTVDTYNLVVEDPLILLAKGQTGTPTLDIGFIGKRGTSQNIAFVWDEANDQFVTAYTSSETTNTTITISSYADLKVSNLTVAGTSTFTGNVASLTVTGSITGGNLLTSGVVSATGNVSGGNITTVGRITATGNVQAGNLLTTGLISSTGSITTADGVTATANVTGGNLTTVGLITATGNIQGGNLNTAGLVSATGNLIGGNVTTTGLISSTGNLISGNVNTAGSITATGNVQGGNLLTTGLISSTGSITTAGGVTATANISAGNVLTGGQVSATGNVTGQYILGNGFYLNGVANAQTASKLVNGTSNVDIPTANGNVTFGINGTGNVLVVANTGTYVTGVNSVSGNVTGGNVLTGGLISATGSITSANGITATANITGGNLTTAGIMSATGNAYANNFIGSTLSVSGNTTAGNLLTAGLISSTGSITSANGITATANITGGNVTTVGIMSSTGNAIHGNVLTGGLVSATGNVTGGNVTTTGQVSATGNLTAGNISTAGVVYITNTANATANNTGALQVSGGASFALDVWVAGNVYAGNIVAIQANTLSVQDPLLYLTANTPYPYNYDIGFYSQFQTSPGNPTPANGYQHTGWVRKYTDNVWYLFSNVGEPGTTVTLDANTVYDTMQAGNVISVGYVSAGGNVIGGNIRTTGLISASGNITGGNLNATNLSLTGNIVSPLNVTGNITGGNLLTTGLVSATGNVTGGNIATAGVITATGTLTAGNLLTGGLVSATGSITSANGITATANITGGNLLTGGLISATSSITSANGITATANVTGGNLTTAGQITATANITGGNILTGGSVSATSNVTGGNLLTVGIVSSTGNAIHGNVLTSGFVSATGNVTGGNLLTAGLISATGSITSANGITATGDVTGGNITTTGQVTATANVTAGNLVTGGLVTATGNVTGGNVITSGRVTAGGNVYAGTYFIGDGGLLSNVSAAVTVAKIVNGTSYANIAASGGNLEINIGGATIETVASTGVYVNGINSSTGNVIAGNVTTAGLVTATGNVIAGNVTTPGLVSATGNVQGGNILGAQAIFGTSFTPQACATVTINATDSVLMPVGNTLQRPNTTAIGMLRFNTAGDALEVYTSTGWQDVGVPAFTVITDQQFSGTGACTTFTLSADSTTAATIVSINGVLQIPTTAYAVTGNSLVFTEAPAITDTIDVRALTTTTTVTGVENISGNAAITTLDTSAAVQVLGNLLPVGNAVYNLGGPSNYWKSLYVGGNTIYLGNLQLKEASANTFAVYTSDGVTQANIDVGSIDVTSITSGTTAIGIGAPNGNAYLAPAGSNALVAASTGVYVTGVMSASGNITGSYIFGNGSLLTGIITSVANINNGTSNMTVVSSGGNIAASIGGTSNVWVAATTGVYVTGLQSVTANVIAGNVTTAGVVTATGNITGGNLLTGGLISATSSITSANGITATANVTGGNITTAGIMTSTGNAIHGNVLTGGLVSATGNIVTAGNLNITGDIYDTGALTINTASNGNITLSPNGTGLIVANKDIVNGQSNGVGNIGSATGYFNTVFAKATSAQYADLAEMYEADAILEPGTVVSFGGNREITQCNEENSRRIAGVVSTNPSYIMNAGLDGDHVTAVALTGRVPTKVTGTIRKGDMLVAAGAGRARAEADPVVGTVIGKALADFDGVEGVIEVVVGRL